ncbi:hypothetical protein [Massilia niabensis]|uniref:Uncharacterized protein n=1 Tax=Massilia niabensis TaxID=544910 RepID=A0ABW0LAS3_9BURK
MSTSTDKQDAQGRSWDQVTKDGSSSAGSMGVGGTGDSGKLDRHGQGQQSDAGTPATRTDDLLTDGCDQDADGDAFHSSGGRVETGLEGIGSMTGGGAGNRQSAGQSGAQGRQGGASDTEEGEAVRKDQQNR